MTIEISPPIAPAKPASTPAKPTATSGTTNNKEKANAPDKSHVNAQKDFMDILASLGAASDAVLPIADGVPQKDLLTAPDAEADAAALLAQSLQWMSSPIDTQKDGRTDAATDMTSANGVNPMFVLPPGGVTPLQRPPEVLNLEARPGVGPLDVLSGAGHKNGKGPLDTAALQSAFGADEGAAVAETARTDGRDTKFETKFLQAEMAVHTFSQNAEPAPPLAATIAKREEQKVDHSVFKPVASEATVTPSGSPNWIGSASGYSATGTVDATQATEMYVAEQVSYWISNDVQNAEMTLDGIGEKPVEVSININGNEAHVSFRTDEVMARDVLENASQHLKDMLLREGVVLSGVSVGNFGAGDSGGQERNPRQGSRQAAVVADQTVIKDVRSAGVKGSVRALDLFV